MVCNQIRPQLMDYAWQRLSATEAGAVDAHLGECVECRAVLEEERALAHAIAGVPIARPRVDLWDTVRARQMALSTPLTAASSAAPLIAATWRPYRRAWTLALSAGVAALALMLAPTQPVQENATAQRDIAQTLDNARMVARQSDNPLQDVSDRTWAALSENGKDSSL